MSWTPREGDRVRVRLTGATGTVRAVARRGFALVHLDGEEQYDAFHRFALDPLPRPRLYSPDDSDTPHVVPLPQLPHES